MLPKHHMMTHIAAQLLADGIFLWCFMLERKNIASKTCMTHNRARDNFETGMYSRMLAESFRQLERPSWAGHHFDSTEHDCPELAVALGVARCRLGLRLRWQDTAIRAGQPLFVKDDKTLLLVVACCISADDILGLLVHECHLIHADALTSRWAPSARIQHRPLMPGQRLLTPPFWRHQHSQCLICLLYTSPSPRD